MYHTLSDYRDQNKNYSNQPFQTNKNINQKLNNNTLTTMKKGVMVNGSEVYYGKGIKVDPHKSSTKKSNPMNNINRLNKKIANNKTNKIGHNRPVQYVSKEEKKEEVKITKTVVNKRVEESEEILVDLNKPHCSISVRMYNGDVIKTEMNCDKKLRDIYSLVKKFGKNRIIDFVLLDGFPPKPLVELDKSIEELGIENSILTQKTDKI